MNVVPLTITAPQKTMKKIIFTIVVIILVGGLGYWLGMANDFLEKEYGTMTFTQPEPEVRVEKIEELEVRIENALNAALPEIETQATAMYEKAVAEAEAAKNKFIESEKTKVTDKAKEDYIAEIEATISSEGY